MTENLKIQKLVVITGVILFIIKIVAWYITSSVAIFTDALESTVNVMSSFIGLYSLYLSARPKDFNHPYGHGKVEFISAAIEGTLITIAGVVIIYEASFRLNNPAKLEKLDLGLLLIALAALVNYLVGYYSEKIGRKNNSLALIASGTHLKSDTWTSVGIIVGLIALYITEIKWIDGALAIVFALFIIYQGFKIVRASVAGIMDEADLILIKDLVSMLQQNRSENWIDLHNLRIIKYGSTLHLDCHLTIPWYFNIHEGHDEIDQLEKLVKTNYGESVELFVHTDGCLDFSCNVCNLENCAVRKKPYIKTLEWTLENISSNSKHRVDL